MSVIDYTGFFFYTYVYKNDHSELYLSGRSIAHFIIIVFKK